MSTQDQVSIGGSGHKMFIDHRALEAGKRGEQALHMLVGTAGQGKLAEHWF